MSISRKSAAVPDDEKDYGFSFKNKNDIPNSLEHALNLIRSDAKKQGYKEISSDCDANTYKIVFNVG